MLEYSHGILKALHDSLADNLQEAEAKGEYVDDTGKAHIQA